MAREVPTKQCIYSQKYFGAPPSQLCIRVERYCTTVFFEASSYKESSQMWLFLLVFHLLATMLLCDSVRAQGCVYLEANKTIRNVPNLSAVPRAYRKNATCKQIGTSEIVEPESVDVGVRSRTSSFGSSLGVMHARWARELERCYKSTPSKAVAEAARTVSRALRASRLLSNVHQEHREWSFVFTDQAHAITQFPVGILQGKHPGFMLPPNKIYILSDFIAPECMENPIHDELLLQVLLHEMGHVIEYILLGEPPVMSNRERGEGFATWFEQYSAAYSSMVDEDRVESYFKDLERSTEIGVNGEFKGTPHEYAHAAVPFKMIVAKKGVASIGKVYRQLQREPSSLQAAIMRVFGWSERAYKRNLREFQAGSSS